MAKNTLPTNYTDDIMNASMGNKRRYKMIQNSDGTISLDDATIYDKNGSDFGAGNINAISKAVNESADAAKIIDKVDDIKANTQVGMITGALATKKIISDLSELPRIEYGKCKFNPSGTGNVTMQQKIVFNKSFSSIPIAVSCINNTTYPTSNSSAIANITLSDMTISYQTADAAGVSAEGGHLVSWIAMGS